MNKKMMALLLVIGGCTNGMLALKSVNGDAANDLAAAADIVDALTDEENDNKSQTMADTQDGSRWGRVKASANNFWNRAANSRVGQFVGNNKKKAAVIAALLALMAASRGAAEYAGTTDATKLSGRRAYHVPADFNRHLWKSQGYKVDNTTGKRAAGDVTKEYDRVSNVLRRVAHTQYMPEAISSRVKYPVKAV